VSWWLHPMGPRRAAGARRCERAPRTRVPSSVDAVSSSRRVRGCALIDRRARPCRGRGATLGLEVLRSTRRPGDRARVRRRPCAPEPGDGAGVSEDPRTAAIAIRHAFHAPPPGELRDPGPVAVWTRRVADSPRLKKNGIAGATLRVACTLYGLFELPDSGRHRYSIIDSLTHHASLCTSHGAQPR
jgi:hypothetical protein